MDGVGKGGKPVVVKETTKWGMYAFLRLNESYFVTKNAGKKKKTK